MTWFLYNVLFAIGFTLLLPKFLLRMWRRGGYSEGFLDRFGLYSPEVRRRLAARPRAWVHAVSVGEVYVATRVMSELRARRPELSFILTVTTSTGRRVARERLAADDILLCFPLDFPPITRRVLRILRPAAVILTECELWPNLVRLAGSRGIPVMLINGRISNHSYGGYRRLRFFTLRLLRHVQLCLMQGDADAERIRSLGAPAERVHVMGSVKFDLGVYGGDGVESVRPVLQAAGFPDDALLLVGGSTWPGEEALLLATFMRLRTEYPDLRLVLVPRHQERAPHVIREIERTGLQVAVRSVLGEGAGRREAGPAQVLLVDTTGELMRFYSAATVVFVGKSLTAHGGQNFIEAAACGKAVITGPYVENFEAVADDFLAENAMIRVHDGEALTKGVRGLLSDPKERRACGERARAVIEHRRGASARSAELLLPLILRDVRRTTAPQDRSSP